MWLILALGVLAREPAPTTGAEQQLLRQGPMTESGEYLNGIRHGVNYHWERRLKALPPEVRLTEPTYTTELEVILDRSGAIRALRVVRPSGSAELDAALEGAFHDAQPFLRTPPSMRGPDGNVRLPRFSFTVQVGPAGLLEEAPRPRPAPQRPPAPPPAGTAPDAGADYLEALRQAVTPRWQARLGAVRAPLTSGYTYTTGLELEIDPAGALVSVRVSRTSHVPALDEAIVNAFRDATPFPQPPESLLGPDGHVHLPSAKFTVVYGTPLLGERPAAPSTPAPTPAPESAPPPP